jgi:sporulation protein YlmC with PRC-barrel domain
MQTTECPPARGVSIREKQGKPFSIDPQHITATTVIGDKVIGKDGKELGKIEEIMLDLTTGRVKYLVLSSGGILGIGDRFFALPLEHLTFDPEERIFYLDIERNTLKRQPGFDKEDWPSQAEWPINRRR